MDIKSEGRNKEKKEKIEKTVMRILLLTMKMVLVVEEMAEIIYYKCKV